MERVIKDAPLEDVLEMRREVMYPAFSIEQVRLKDDEEGNHIGLYVDGKLIAVISVFVRIDIMQFRKFATKESCQGKGYGTHLLEYVMKLAKDRHCISIWCNARVSAKKFYEKFGMQVTGDTWLQDGHEFIKMEKQL
ncbi:GNAT family N-acetyltransferase [Pinibacter soli]|uniref:GNAT family N-acetyltransferase n=1 Tax=Pinibacter soli TaxID=3044211 RepID=A0ABT6R9N4_9BACT|nr:GNAT family N-acetyltransferase [Pinibacter soli]MDI3319186.1 GNAT family N-acetyltransferase [Pinibacter soli]